MPLTPNFTAQQSAGTPSNILLTDTSTGSDLNIVARRVYLLDAWGNYVVPTGVTTNYIVWPLADSTITLDVLTQDTALTITVQWVDIAGVPVEEKTISFGFDAYSQTFLYGLTQSEVPVSVPSAALSTQYYSNKNLFFTNLESANQAIIWASDILSAQYLYNANTEMIVNQEYYFS